MPILPKRAIGTGAPLRQAIVRRWIGVGNTTGVSRLSGRPEPAFLRSHLISCHAKAGALKIAPYEDSLAEKFLPHGSRVDLCRGLRKSHPAPKRRRLRRGERRH